MSSSKRKLLPPAKSTKPASRMEQARAALRANHALRAADIMREFGMSERAAREAIANVRAEGVDLPTRRQEKESTPAEQPVTTDFSDKAGTASSCNSRIKTAEQLLRAAKVDLSVWEIERQVVNKWEVGAIPRATGSDAKGWSRRTTRVMIEPLFQVKVWLRRKSPQVVGAEAFLKKLLAEVRHVARPPRQVRFKRLTGACLAEIDQPDLHLGKLAWAAESGEDYDVRIAEQCYREGIAHHREHARNYGVTRFLLPIGNDFLNVDNAAGTTTAGTRQDEDGRWQRSYTRGFALLRWTIDYLLEVAPVDVVQVSGNHDFERGFYLAHALECVYEKHPHVRIDNSPANRKYYAWGNSLIGFTHGDKELTKDLPLTMAVEQPEMWAAAKFREFHCGHLHHERERVFQPVLEEKGVVVRHLSSLTAADAWHAGKGYRAQRASACFIRHREYGLLAELKFNLISAPPSPHRAVA